MLALWDKDENQIIIQILFSAIEPKFIIFFLDNIHLAKFYYPVQILMIIH